MCLDKLLEILILLLFCCCRALMEHFARLDVHTVESINLEDELVS